MKSVYTAWGLFVLFRASTGGAEECWKYLTTELGRPLTAIHYLVDFPPGTHLLMSDSHRRRQVSGYISPIFYHGHRLRNAVRFTGDCGRREAIGLAYLSRATIDAVPGFTNLDTFSLNSLQDALPFLTPASRVVVDFAGRLAEVTIRPRPATGSADATQIYFSSPAFGDVRASVKEIHAVGLTFSP